MRGTTAHGLQIAGDHVYVASSAGLFIFDKRNPTNLTPLGHYPVTSQNFRVQVWNKTAYLSKKEDGLELVDVSDPAQPIRIGGCDTPGRASSFLVLDGDVGLIADGEAGLSAVNISESANPKIVARYETNGSANDIVTNNGQTLVLVANGTGGLLTLDMADPFNPTIITNIATHNALRLHVAGRMGAGNFAYLADGLWGIKVFELEFRNPPKLISSFQTGESARSVFTDGFMLYVANGNLGVRSVELAAPDNPFGGGGFDTFDYVTDVSVAGDYLYATGAKTGLKVFKIKYFPNPTLNILASREHHQLFWGREGESYHIEKALSLAKPVIWEKEERSPSLINNVYQLTLPRNADRQFFRLIKTR